MSKIFDFVISFLLMTVFTINTIIIVLIQKIISLPLIIILKVLQYINQKYIIK